jgi:hypothetical protein
MMMESTVEIAATPYKAFAEGTYKLRTQFLYKNKVFF